MDCCKQNHNNSQKENSGNPPDFFQKYKLLFFCVGGIVAVFTILKITNIRIETILPYGILLLCPLMHIFMMKGHGDHTENNKSQHS